MSKQEDLRRPEKPLKKMQEIDNESRISKKAEMKRKFNRNQKRITLWDIQQYNISHHWYFLDKRFKCQVNIYNGCHDLLMMSMNLSDLVILNIKGADYRCIISKISNSEAINLMLNINLTRKSRTWKRNLLSYMKKWLQKW